MYLAQYHTAKDIDVLFDLVYNCIHGYHTGIKMIPAEVTDQDPHILKVNIEKYTKAFASEIMFNIGDRVMYMINKTPRTSMNKAKHNKTTYEDQKQHRKSVDTPYFRDADEYEDVYEVQKRKKITYQNMPKHLSTASLQYAKLRMLAFHYDFLCKYVEREYFNMLYMDMDNMYMAITSDKFEDLIKPGMKEDYMKVRYNWFPRNVTKENEKYDSRTMGLFKTEFMGNGMCCLSSKLYYCLGEDGKKDI